jgi:FtsX extracellular domain
MGGRGPQLARAADLRMTRNPTRLALVAAAAALLVSGCGSSSSSEGTTSTVGPQAKLVPATLVQPEGCFLTVFLSESVTPAQTAHVQLLLLSNPRIVEVSFVSKQLALKRLAATQPDIAANMHVNPFPDQFEVVPRLRVDVFAIITDFAAGVDGVTNVRASPACAQA